METKTEKKPLGWSERYKIVNDPDILVKIHNWINDGRGLSIWANADLSGGPFNSICGHLMFTPGDAKQSPHWAYYIVETVQDESRLDFFVEETSRTKPKKSTGWTYDKRAKEWYREVSAD